MHRVVLTCGLETKQWYIGWRLRGEKKRKKKAYFAEWIFYIVVLNTAFLKTFKLISH